jgi:hypothetical protein
VAFTWNNCGKPRKTPVKIAGVSTENRNEYPPKISLSCYRWTKLFSILQKSVQFRLLSLFKCLYIVSQGQHMVPIVNTTSPTGSRELKLEATFRFLISVISYHCQHPQSHLRHKNQKRRSESESHVTTDGQSASPSWNKAHIWGLRPDLYYCQTVAGLLMWDALSDERTGVVYNCCWPSPAQSFSSSSPVRLATIFYCLRFETSFFVASYDSQSYGGSIRTSLHTR